MPQTRRPKLGQHFLRDTRYRQRIADALAILPFDLVIEIGAGRAAMTELLSRRARQVIAIEIDPTLVEELQGKFGADSHVAILQADILSVDLPGLCQRYAAERCFVFGNLPYYITSPIIHRLLEFAASIRAMGLLVQYQVAERLTAAPGSRRYGYLSVLVQLYSQPRIVLAVPPGAFSPAPKVQSALVDFPMAPKFPEWTSADRKQFLEFVKRCFAQKRKNLSNNLLAIYGRELVERMLAALDLPRTIRAEQLTLAQFGNLFRRLR
jgi:16S rRNA (adenine1518-N6/adenine1519-N6)-dimethyltransferase